jgi:hypothetical protein
MRDVQAHRRTHRLSLEEAAREVRYAFPVPAAPTLSPWATPPTIRLRRS